MEGEGPALQAPVTRWTAPSPHREGQAYALTRDARRIAVGGTMPASTGGSASHPGAAMPESQTLLTSPAPSSAAGPRRVRDAQGRTWRVTAVRPNDVLGERRLTADDRRVMPVEDLLDPPVLQRRKGRDRRVANEPRHATPGALLPPNWREGWLMFESDEEVRRLAPIPDDWTSMADAELAGLLPRTARRGH